MLKCVRITTYDLKSNGRCAGKWVSERGWRRALPFLLQVSDPDVTLQIAQGEVKARAVHPEPVAMPGSGGVIKPREPHDIAPPGFVASEFRSNMRPCRGERATSCWPASTVARWSPCRHRSQRPRRTGFLWHPSYN